MKEKKRDSEKQLVIDKSEINEICRKSLMGAVDSLKEEYPFINSIVTSDTVAVEMFISPQKNKAAAHIKYYPVPEIEDWATMIYQYQLELPKEQRIIKTKEEFTRVLTGYSTLVILTALFELADTFNNLSNLVNLHSYLQNEAKKFLAFPDFKEMINSENVKPVRNQFRLFRKIIEERADHIITQLNENRRNRLIGNALSFIEVSEPNNKIFAKHYDEALLIWQRVKRRYREIVKDEKWREAIKIEFVDDYIPEDLLDWLETEHIEMFEEETDLSTPNRIALEDAARMCGFKKNTVSGRSLRNVLKESREWLAQTSEEDVTTEFKKLTQSYVSKQEGFMLLTSAMTRKRVL
jgi:hypothetical protein